MLISVVGGDSAAAEAALAAAEAVGRELARRGCVLVCGGLGGVMEAACRGARAEGGHTIGILPGADRSDANPYVEFPIITGMGFARNAIVVLSGQAVIAVDGSYGTLSEIAYALAYGKPVVGLYTWDFEYEGHDAESIIRVSDPKEAVDRAIAAAKGRNKDTSNLES